MNDVFISYIKGGVLKFRRERCRAVNNSKAWLQKPDGGLWATPQHDLSWKEWCDGNMPEWHFERSDAVRFKFKPGTRILHIYDDKSFLEVYHRFGRYDVDPEFSKDKKCIDWVDVARHYDAVYFHWPKESLIDDNYYYNMCFTHCDLESVCVFNTSKIILLLR